MTLLTHIVLGSVLFVLFTLYAIFFPQVESKFDQYRTQAFHEQGIAFWKHSIGYWLWKGYVLIYALLLSWMLLGIFSSVYYIHLVGFIVYGMLEESCYNQNMKRERYMIAGRILMSTISVFLLVSVGVLLYLSNLTM